MYVKRVVAVARLIVERVTRPALKHLSVLLKALVVSEVVSKPRVVLALDVWQRAHIFFLHLGDSVVAPFQHLGLLLHER